MLKRYKTLILVALCMLFSLIPSTASLAYDWNAPHDVNQNVDIEETKKKIWVALRKAGCTEECAAGMMGNLQAESTYNYTLVESGRSWSAGVRGACGIGLCQWTSSGRQDALMAICDSKGVQWMDIDCQIEHLINELADPYWLSLSRHGYHFDSLEEFKNCTDIERVCGAFCYNWERPNDAYAHFDSRRLPESQAAYEQFKGTPVDGADSEDKEEQGTGGESKMSEWGLTGMPKESKLSADGKEIELKDSTSLSTGENYSVQTVREGLDTLSMASAITKGRVAVCFVGVLLIFYSIFLVLATVFDKTNQFIDISMVSVLTFGRLVYSDDEVSKGHEGYIQTSKIVKVCIITLIVGLFLVSGGIFLYMSKFILFITDRLIGIRG